MAAKVLRQADQGLDLLAVGAHPDDVELGCGGTLARFSREGLRVGILDLTEGELASRGSRASRRREARAASRVLGVAARVNLRLTDGAIDASAPGALKAMVRSLRRLRPRVLALPWTVTRHPDHQQTGRLGERAAFMAGLQRYPVRLPPHRPGLVIYYMEQRPFQPSFVLDVSRDHATKMQAIGCYTTQFAVGDDAPAGPDTFISRPEFLEELEARDRHYGALAGVRYAEPFVTAGPLPVAPATLLDASRVPA
jgi:bacillithiol biosynthesis deacetylase BshB1